MPSNISSAGHENSLISSLSNRVSQLSASIVGYLDTNGHGQPDFTRCSSVVPETREYEVLRNQMNDTILDLHRLVNGPKNIFRTQNYLVGDQAATQVALSRKYFQHVPADDTGISAAALAEKAGMDEDRTTRFLKILATQRIFEEAEGKFRHTATSEFLRTSVCGAMAELSYDDTFKAASEMNKHIDEFPYSAGLKECAFYRKFGSTYYEVLEQDPKRAARFFDAMKGWSLMDDGNRVLQKGFDWSKLHDRKVVDIGGGDGHVSLDLAREYPKLKVVVQDAFSHQLSAAEATEFGDRVSFQQYDYFTPQPIRDAGAYLFRSCFHNHNDEECAKMLQAIIPALVNRTDDPRLLINDCIVPECAEGDITRSEEHQHRQMDMIVGVFRQESEKMASTPPAFEEFHRRCLKVCSRLNPPDNASCIICTENYDHAEHRAIRIKVKSPTPCNHVFCEACLQEMFSRRGVQDGANKCPLCRAVWFKAEFESPDAHRRRVMDSAENPTTASAENPATPPEQDWKTFFTLDGWDYQIRTASRPVSRFRRLTDMVRSSTYSGRQYCPTTARSRAIPELLGLRLTHPSLVSPNTTVRPTSGPPTLTRFGPRAEFFEALAMLGHDQVAQNMYWDEQMRLLGQRLDGLRVEGE
ncbi:Sterigmatocystin 8-O-methyltransferase [Pyrenophora teres f. maculata]|nr:Sterigmatocystin 8-O-methyltransferase [Pyrenophora teres f. maculata]